MNNTDLKFQIALVSDIPELTKLSTEKLIIWIIGNSLEQHIVLSNEEIVIECWLINPEKHSLRKYHSYPDSHTVLKRIGEMKGKKGLLTGSSTTGYYLTDISKIIFANLKNKLE